MRVQVKICGITNLEDALFCALAGTNMLGFIFFEKSPRYIDPGKAIGIIKRLPASVIPVGVFVNEPREHIRQIIKQTGIRTLQLSGDETPDDCSGYNQPVIKAFRFKDVSDVTVIQNYTIAAAMLDGANDGQYGGSGILADFSLAREMKKHHPFFLAGGLHPGNIVGAVKTVSPFAVDVNSGVESAPGKKDYHKVKLLFEELSSLNSVTL